MNSEKNKIDKKTSAAILIILICICLFHIINNYFWIQKDVLSWYPEKYYQLGYKNVVFFSLRNVIHSNYSFLDKFISVAKLIRRVGLGFGWGVIFYIYTACINLILGNNTNVSLIGNVPLFILLIIFTFLVGKNISGEKEGILAAFLVSFYPGIYGISRSYGVDFPLIVMVTISIYVLTAKDITKIKYSLLLSLVTGFTLLIKATGAYFLIGPLVFIFYQYIYKIAKGRQKDDRTNIHIFQIFLALGLAIALALFFLSLMFSLPSPKHFFNYIYNLYNTVFFPLRGVRRHFYSVSPYDIFSIKSLFFYVFEMMYSMSKPLFLLFCVGLLLFWKARLRFKMLICLWVLIPYAMFTLNVDKWGRYYFPAFPALALITAIGIFQVRSIKCKIILVTMATSLCLLQFYDLSFGSNILPKGLYKHPKYSFVAYPPQKCEEERVVTRFLETINKEKKDPDYKYKVLFVAPRGIIDYGKLEYIFQTKESNVEFVKFFMASSNYKNYDYIIALNNKINVAYAYKPNLSFLKIPGYYNDFLRISYPQFRISNAELEEMYDVFSKLEVVDYYFADNLFFYLCKNTKRQQQ
jgi:hypothetical protein